MPYKIYRGKKLVGYAKTAKEADKLQARLVNKEIKRVGIPEGV